MKLHELRAVPGATKNAEEKRPRSRNRTGHNGRQRYERSEIQIRRRRSSRDSKVVRCRCTEDCRREDFTNIWATEYTIVNVEDLEQV